MSTDHSISASTQSDTVDSPYKYFEEANPGVVRLLPAGKRVLDVGCGYGALAPELKKKENYCVGVDISADAIEIARARYDEVYLFDLEGDDPLPFDPGQPFDRIIFGDVLEHLYDPAAAIQRFEPCLAPDGRIIVSVPNIATWPVRMALFFGRFDYTETGTLDWTHIRFFTRKTSRRLLESLGYRVERRTITPNFTRVLLKWVRRLFLKGASGPSDPRAIIDSAPYRFYLNFVFPVETLIARLNTNLFAFQFVYEARRDGGAR